MYLAIKKRILRGNNKNKRNHINRRMKVHPLPYVIREIVKAKII